MKTLNYKNHSIQIEITSDNEPVFHVLIDGIGYSNLDSSNDKTAISNARKHINNLC